jgi:hypothetical protein
LVALCDRTGLLCFSAIARKENTMTTKLEGYLGPSAAARQLGVAPVTLRLWMQQGKIPALRTPIGRVLKAEDVERLAQERAIKTTEASLTT